MITTILLPALLLVSAVVVAQAGSPHFTVLHSFHGTDGEWLTSNLGKDTSGNLYGYAQWGGDLNCSLNPGVGCGVVFKLSKSGKRKVLHRFTGLDGYAPGAFEGGGSLVRDQKGTIYGTTTAGGTGTQQCSIGCGTVFKIDTTGKETVIYNFTGMNGDGAYPSSGVVLDEAGNLYGTTASGGAYLYHGTVFKIDTTGKETILYSFKGVGSSDGSVPDSLVKDQAGNLYGTTLQGGVTTSFCPNGGCGTVFKITRMGQETVLYSFTYDGTNTDGAKPNCNPAVDSAGNIYGTTTEGGVGANGGLGTIFRVSRTGKEKVLHAFTGADGSFGSGSVQLDAAGNLYGVTFQGGTAGYGVVFKLTKTGKETVLHSFSGGTDGANPSGGVILDSTNNVYGTTSLGGDLSCNVQGQGQGCGVVFKIAP